MAKETSIWTQKINKARNLGIQSDFTNIKTSVLNKMISMAEKQRQQAQFQGIPLIEPEQQPIQNPTQQNQQQQQTIDLRDQQSFQRNNNSIPIYPHSSVFLQCVKEGSKLWIKFHSFRDRNGKYYSNTYNNSYNCQFPKDIWEEGRYYEIPDYDITLSQSSKQPFYVIKKNNIKIVSLDEINIQTREFKIFPVEQCIVCFDETPSVIYFPCGHQCACNACSNMYMTVNSYERKCPLCRRYIESTQIQNAN